MGTNPSEQPVAAPETRVALVVGASSGAGRSVALALAQNGLTVFTAARRADRLRQLVTEAPTIRSLELDATDRAAVDRAIAVIEREAGRLDIVVAAAGVNVPRRRIAELSSEDWHTIMETNVTATFHTIQASLPLLRAAAGLVIIIGSVSSRWPDASGPAYQASKYAVLGLAESVALDERAIRVTAVLPGVIDTPLLEARPQPPPPEQRALMIEPEDIGSVCAFLANLPPRVYVPEIVVLPSALQRIGATS